jgi:hypothetical protein
VHGHLRAQPQPVAFIIGDLSVARIESGRIRAMFRDVTYVRFRG